MGKTHTRLHARALFDVDDQAITGPWVLEENSPICSVLFESFRPQQGERVAVLTAPNSY